MQGHSIDDNSNSTAHNTGGADAGDGAAEDKSSRIGGGAADGGADLEEGDGGDEDIADRVKGVELAKGELEGAVGEHKGAAVPANVGLGAEVVCDLRDGRRDDEAVQGDQEHADEGGCHQGGQLEPGRVDNVLGPRPRQGDGIALLVLTRFVGLLGPVGLFGSLGEKGHALECLGKLTQGCRRGVVVVVVMMV